MKAHSLLFILLFPLISIANSAATLDTTISTKVVIQGEPEKLQAGEQQEQPTMTLKKVLILDSALITDTSNLTSSVTLDLIRPAEKSGLTLLKGRGYVGFTFAISFEEGHNYKELGIIPITEKNSTHIAVDVLGGYMIKKYFSIGGGLGYQYDRVEGQYTDTTINRSIKSTYSVIPHIRNYLPWTEDLFFQIYNQTNLGFAYGTGVQETDNGTSIDRAYTTEFGFHLGFQPGMSFFVAKGVTVETSINLLGFSMKRQKIDYNGESSGYYNSTSVDFRINLLSLHLGITVYI